MYCSLHPGFWGQKISWERKIYIYQIIYAKLVVQPEEQDDLDWHCFLTVKTQKIIIATTTDDELFLMDSSSAHSLLRPSHLIQKQINMNDKTMAFGDGLDLVELALRGRWNVRAGRARGVHKN